MTLDGSNVVWRRHIDYIQPRVGNVPHEPELSVDTQGGVDIPSSATSQDPTQVLVSTPHQSVTSLVVLPVTVVSNLESGTSFETTLAKDLTDGIVTLLPVQGGVLGPDVPRLK